MRRRKRARQRLRQKKNTISNNMGKYKTIAVIYGSDSSEWEVACRSGEFTASRIDGDKYDVYEIFARFGKWQLVACKKKDAMRMTFPEGARPEVDKTDFSITVLGEKVRFDFVYIMHSGRILVSGLPKDVAESEIARKGYLSDDFHL